MNETCTLVSFVVFLQFQIYIDCWSQIRKHKANVFDKVYLLVLSFEKSEENGTTNLIIVACRLWPLGNKFARTVLKWEWGTV